MRTANWHTFQVLTKRADVLSKLLRKPLQPQAALSHIWWGVSVEDRKYGLLRIDHLRATPAVRFLSIEPLLEDLGTINLTGIHWVIVGGETGPAARSMEAAWVGKRPVFLQTMERCPKLGGSSTDEHTTNNPIVHEQAVVASAERHNLIADWEQQAMLFA